MHFIFTRERYQVLLYKCQSGRQARVQSFIKFGCKDEHLFQSVVAYENSYNFITKTQRNHCIFIGYYTIYLPPLQPNKLSDYTLLFVSKRNVQAIKSVAK